MSFNLFGKRPKNAANNPEATTNQINETIRVIQKREMVIESKIKTELTNAKKYAKTNKRNAILALRRKTYYENELTKLSGARLNLEMQMMTLQGAQVNLEALKGLQAGTRALQGIHKRMTVEQAEELADDFRDQMDIASELNNVISTPLVEFEEDDDELLAQLDEMVDENDTDTISVSATAVDQPLPSQALPGIKISDLGPSVPTTTVEPVSTTTTSEPEIDDADFDNLEQLMGQV